MDRNTYYCVICSARLESRGVDYCSRCRDKMVNEIEDKLG